MKLRFTWGLLLLNTFCYSQTFNNDTTLSGTYNAAGKVMYINAKISGTVTINNAIIVANPYQQIFDTTVTLGTGNQCERFSAMWYGAKPSLQDNSRQLQYAINASINKAWWLYVPTGTYTYKDSLIVKTGNYGSYGQSQIKIYGESQMWGDGGSVFYYTGDFCALGLQLNKGSEIKNLALSGKWISPYTSGSTYYNYTLANYTNQSVSGGNGNGLCIDPFGDWNQRSGSTGCYFHEMQIGNFMTNVKISNSITQNGEIMVFDNIQIKDGRYGFVTSQGQEKGNILRGIYSWGRIHTLFNMNYGNYYIDGANVAGSCIRLFNIQSAGWFPIHIRDVYAENFGTIGNIATNLRMNIYNCVFDFALKTDAGAQTLLTSGAGLKFDNCQFRYYGASDTLGFATNSIFDNCLFGTVTTGVGSSTFLSYSNGTVYYQMTPSKIDTIPPQNVKISIRSSQ